MIIRGYDDFWQADLVDMRAYSRVNAGNQYILTVIDTFSKCGWAEAIKTKIGCDKRFSQNNIYFRTTTEESTNRRWQGIFQQNFSITYGKTWDQSLFNLQRHEGIDRRTIQQNIKEQYVETIYDKWWLQVD